MNMNVSTYDESKHRRSADGRFTEKVASESAAHLPSASAYDGVRSNADLLAPRDTDADITEATDAVAELVIKRQSDDEAGYAEAKTKYTQAMAKMAASPGGREEVESAPDFWLHDDAYDGIGFQAREIFDANAKHAQDRENGLAALRASGVGFNTRELTRDDIDKYPTTALVERFDLRSATNESGLDPAHTRVLQHDDDGTVVLHSGRGAALTYIDTANGTTSTGTFNLTADARIDDQGNVISTGGDPAQSVEMVLRPVDETPRHSASETLEGIRRGKRGEIKDVNPAAADALLEPGRRVTLHNPFKQNGMPKKSLSKHTGRIVGATTEQLNVMDDKGDLHKIPLPGERGSADNTWTLDRNDRLITSSYAPTAEPVTWKIGFDQ